jgi:cyclopropane fatty-acyl-phospholipid synthase-like methyltransferase
MMRERFAAFWKDIDVPLHRSDDDEHYQAYGKELRLLLEGRQSGAVLELGCGNGGLYNHLGFDQSSGYVGVDFSPAMIKRYKQKHPELELHCADASTFCVDRKFDVIFSNAMIQNFDNEMLEQHIFNAKHMLADGGVFICASYPAGALKKSYYSGESGSDPKKARLINWIMTIIRGADRPMGKWHYNKDIALRADRHGLKCQFFGSLYYLYRNHVVMTAK